MNCQKFETVAGELARGRMMMAELREEALAHSNDCARCSSRLGDEEMLSRGLRSLGYQTSSLEAPPAVEANLLNAFRQAKVVVPIVPVREPRRYWVAAVAALLLVVFGLLAARTQFQGKPAPLEAVNNSEVPKNQTAPIDNSQGIVAVKSEPAPIAVKAKAVYQSKETPRRNRTVAPDQLQARAASNRNKKDVESNHASNEVATEFMPLSYVNVQALQDGGQIVRVELPRTTLATFGLPVNMDRYNEKVKADILLGMDGMAHAIRFVQEKRLQ
jgi:hypothetical protein